MSAAATALELRNRFDEPVRVRLASGDLMLWDAWLPSRGGLRAPALSTGPMAVEARRIEEATQLAFTTRLDDVDPGARLQAVVRIDRGAPLFALEALGRDAGGLLHVDNLAGEAIELVVRFAHGPYGLAVGVPPGGQRLVDFSAGLRLEATQGGLTARRALAAAAGRWVVGPGAGWPGPSLEPDIDPRGTRLSRLSAPPPTSHRLCPEGT